MSHVKLYIASVRAVVSVPSCPFRRRRRRPLSVRPSRRSSRHRRPSSVRPSPSVPLSSGLCPSVPVRPVVVVVVVRLLSVRSVRPVVFARPLPRLF